MPHDSHAVPHSLSLVPGQPAPETVATALHTAAAIEGFGTDLGATLDWCREVGRWAPRAGEGRTRELWELLAGTARLSVAAGRMLEPHLDALTILAQAGDVDLEGIAADSDATWGVFAAEGPHGRVRATETADGWTLTGTKPWCSLAQHLSHALVTAFVDDTERALFAVDLRDAGVAPHAGPWHARGLRQVVSAPVDFADAPAVPVGGPGWYLRRPGFAWGGMSVAAVWWGAAEGLRSPLERAASSERADQLSLVHLGTADAALWSARAVLAEAATLIDADAGAPARDSDPMGAGAQPDAPTAVDHGLLAQRVRTVVAQAAARVLAEADAALGPGPLVADEHHAARVADLHLYLRQDHAARDVARIGRDVLRNA
ncbi:acyl-CoA dehydrogenase [Microbacterium sp. Marseille-Q6648]|uniref:acyl-CoA dehydrogenase n=1 Tax=Microbacterium sp. Marseille-Q6648 TaxID=2937991 RepID=UPI00203ECCF6|nr:acyl-CoA dehydrogenase [Microbacterium sp. Marseille-Q6648]